MPKPRRKRVGLATGFAKLAMAMALAFPAALCGCRQEESGPDIVSLEGKVEKIKLDSDVTGEITVSYYSEKQKQEVVGTARVTPETEIMINGTLSTLSQLQRGEHVRGDVRVESREEQREITALKIYIDRPVPASPDDQ